MITQASHLKEKLEKLKIKENVNISITRYQKYVSIKKNIANKESNYLLCFPPTNGNTQESKQMPQDDRIWNAIMPDNS